MTDKNRYRSDPCPQCNRETEYLDRWDSFFCPECNIWSDDECGCSSEECEFVGRPTRPAYDIPRLNDELMAAHRELHGKGE